ncbi:MAG TPA: sterol desaturase family protein [Caulobacteraceae bacterium]|jgi:sterol desaturase/sphingolipid hydroxylase (fatty acid hydroxylase superfamily)
MPPSGELQLIDEATWPGRGARRWPQIAVALTALAAYVGLLAIGWQAVQALLPDTLSLTLAGHTVHVGHVHDHIANNALVMLLLLPTAFWLEYLFVGWEGSSLRQLTVRPTASMRTDIAFFLLSQAHVMDVVAKLMLLGASMISGLALQGWLRATFGLQIDASGLPLAAQIALYFGVYSFFDYWTHRIDHTRYFWPLHRYHHAAHDFCVINANREHPAAFVSLFLINLPMAVLGASAEVMIYINVGVAALGMLIHSRIDANWGWIGRWVIQSPNHHRLHHKLDMSEPTGHFAIAPVWDHLFGTWYGDADQSLAIGVAEPYRHGFWIGADLVRDYCDFWRGFFRRATT